MWGSVGRIVRRCVGQSWWNPEEGVWDSFGGIMKTVFCYEGVRGNLVEL